MTVAELKALLDDFFDDTEVFVEVTDGLRVPLDELGETGDGEGAVIRLVREEPSNDG